MLFLCLLLHLLFLFFMLLGKLLLVNMALAWFFHDQLSSVLDVKLLESLTEVI